MDETGWWYLILTVGFFAALAISAVVNRLFLNYNGNLSQTREKRDVIRWAGKPKPEVGGISFYIVFLLFFSFYWILPAKPVVLSSPEIGILLACTLGFVVGLVDDVFHINPFYKFSGQFLCANILYFSGVAIMAFPVQELNYLVTILWVVGLMNSINMLDNMDGIVGVVSFGIGLTLLLFSLAVGGENALAPWLCAGFLGALLGFLYFNWHPSKMIMGDTGSQFLSIFLASFSILFLWHKSAGTGLFDLKQFVLPALAFMLPLIDTITVSIRRLSLGRSPFVGGRDHTTHHLAMAGLTDKQVALIFAFISAALVILVNLLRWMDWHFYHGILAGTLFLGFLGLAQVAYLMNAKRRRMKRMDTPSLKSLEKE